jgi:hypothetical protein
MTSHQKIDQTVDASGRCRLHDSAMETTTASQAFVDQLTARNFVELARVLAPDAVARFLLPRGPQETVGAEAIAGRFEGWFGGASNFTVLSTGNEAVGARSLLRWRFNLSRDGRSSEVIEQLAFVDAGPQGVYRLDLLCSGFLADPEPALSCDVPKRVMAPGS